MPKKSTTAQNAFGDIAPTLAEATDNILFEHLEAPRPHAA